MMRENGASAEPGVGAEWMVWVAELLKLAGG
jgi:hypothetical protein